MSTSAVPLRNTTTSRAAVRMGFVTAGSRVAGFVRVLVVASVLGVSYLGNAFAQANLVSNVLFELLAAGALSAVLVPAFVELLERNDVREAEHVAGGVLGVALIGLGVVAIAGVACAPWLAHLLTVGAPDHVRNDQRELVTYLLRFFVPQILLYAGGTVATAALYALRRFSVTAAAPIANTIIMVALLGVFRVVAGSSPGLDLSTGEQLLLAAAGTGGVVAFVGVLYGACELAGFRLRPRWPWRDARVGEVLRHCGWGVVLHTGAGLLLGAALVAGAGVEGGVVAYQVGWVIFLAPYAVLAQPIHTAILPELVVEAREHGAARVGLSLRWALERLAVLVVPVTAAMMALALPAMRVMEFGGIGREGSEVMAAAVAGLATGLLPYSAFLLLARGYYALHDSRTPGLVSVAAALTGIVVMVAASVTTEGSARIFALGLGHSFAYLVGAGVLGTHLTRRTGTSLWPTGLGRVVLVAAVVGIAVWMVSRSLLDGDASRLTTAVVGPSLGLAGASLVFTAYRVLGVHAALSTRTSPLTKR